MLATVSTEPAFRCVVAVTRDRVCAIIPDIIKPEWPVRMVIHTNNTEQCIVHLVPDHDNGIKGASAAGNSKCYDQHWSYESHIPKGGKTHRFGRTKATTQILDDGTIELRNSEPLKPIMPKRKGVRGKGKATPTVLPPTQGPTNKVMTAVRQMMDMPAPGANALDIGSLRSLVRGINTLKDELGPDLCLSIDPATGKLKAIVEYG